MSMIVRAERGAGVARVMRFAGPQERVGGPGALFLGEPAPSPEAQREVASRLSPEGRGVTRGSLTQGHVLELPLPNQQGRGCEVLRVHLGPGVVRARAQVLSSEGRVLASAGEDARPLSLRVCGARRGSRLALVATKGFGTFDLSSSRER
jgi:hypothetical protein